MKTPRPALPIAVVALCLSGSVAFAAGVVDTGKVVAELWCSSCHLVGPEQISTVSGAAPSFGSIADRSEEQIDALAGFLADPHPPMPDLSLTRQEILDLLAYIASLKQ